MSDLSFPVLFKYRCCASCLKEIVGKDPLNPNHIRPHDFAVEVDFRLSDFSVTPIFFCIWCAVMVDEGDFDKLYHISMRGNVINSLCPKEDDPVLMKSIREEAQSDWDGFSRKYLPVGNDGEDYFRRNVLTNPFVQYEKKVDRWVGIRMFKGSPWPILGIARYMKPNKDRTDFNVIVTKQELLDELSR